MGIKSLHKWLTWNRYEPRPVQWSTWANQTIGVDILGFIYRAKTNRQNPVEELRKLIVFWKSQRIHPIFIFDGKSPPEKRGTQSARKKQKEWDETCAMATCLEPDERNAVKRLLYATGCLYLNAVAEADSLLAYMHRYNHIQAVVSMDMDFLARGCETLLVPSKSEWHTYSLADILAKTGMTNEQFQQLCVLLGSDYTPTLPKLLTIQQLHWDICLKSWSMQDILKKMGIRNADAWFHALEMLRGTGESWNTLLSVAQRDKLIRGIPACEVESCRELGMSEADIAILMGIDTLPTGVFESDTLHVKPSQPQPL